MSDLPELETYQHALRSTYVSRSGDEVGRTYYLVDEDAADAAIAALIVAIAAESKAREKAEAERDRLRGENAALLSSLSRRFERDNAEVERLREMLDISGADVDILSARYDAIHAKKDGDS